jgi:hypothetical protein
MGRSFACRMASATIATCLVTLQLEREKDCVRFERLQQAPMTPRLSPP